MKTKLALVVSVLALSGLAGWYMRAPAKCAYCPDYTCYARCSDDCACVTVGSGGGRCVSIQAVPSYLEHGYSEMP